MSYLLGFCRLSPYNDIIVNASGYELKGCGFPIARLSMLRPPRHPPHTVHSVLMTMQHSDHVIWTTPILLKHGTFTIVMKIQVWQTYATLSSQCNRSVSSIGQETTGSPVYAVRSPIATNRNVLQLYLQLRLHDHRATC